MTPERLFVLNAAIAAGYGAALLVATGPILDVYGIAPTTEGVYMARWFGVGLALWGTLAGPFNALGWIAVGLNLLLGAGFASLQLRRAGRAPAR